MPRSDDREGAWGLLSPKKEVITILQRLWK
jgi:hypothetical protein